MARSRADDILNAWRAAAHSATRPALAPRSARIQPAVPFGILVATAVVLVLLVAHGPRGLVTGPAASFPAGGAPAAVPSADPCTAAPNAGTQLVTIEQGPMRPLLVPGDVVSVTSLAAADLQRGDVVAFDPTTWLKGAAPVPFVMRIVALGGDQVAIRDGHVFVNGAQLDERYVFAGEPTVVQSGAAATWKIPADNMFVLGDDRSSAADSRTYGPLPVAAIIGRVTYRCEPVARRGPIASAPGPSPTPSPPPYAALAARPLVLPAYSGSCPVGPAVTPAAAFPRALGSNRVFLVADPSPPITLGATPRNPDGTWPVKSIWVVTGAGSAPYPEAVIVRGASMHGSGQVQFEGGVERQEGPVMYLAGASGIYSEGLPSTWQEWVGYVDYPGPGCYVFQVDGASFSEQFRVEIAP